MIDCKGDKDICGCTGPCHKSNPSVMKIAKPKSVRDHLKAMGDYFDLDPTKVKFYIDQMELSGKL